MFNLTDMQTPLRAQAQLDATIHTLHLVDQYHPHLLLRQLLLHLVSYVFSMNFLLLKADPSNSLQAITICPDRASRIKNRRVSRYVAGASSAWS